MKVHSLLKIIAFICCLSVVPAVGARLLPPRSPLWGLLRQRLRLLSWISNMPRFSWLGAVG